MYISFIDFKKAFDSVHRKSLWKILRAYGIPHKIVTIIRTFYEHFECSVIVENTLTESFPVKSGVRQGCILSPILFLVVIDWVMRKTTSDHPRGIQWTLFSCLEDLDFADDLAVISAAHNHLQESIEAYCLRMLHKKYFNVSNRWYAPDLHVRKMAIVATTFSVMEVVFFFFPFVT